MVAQFGIDLSHGQSPFVPSIIWDAATHGLTMASATAGANAIVSEIRTAKMVRCHVIERSILTVKLSFIEIIVTNELFV